MQASQPLELRAQYILVKGGALYVGTDAEPFPGQATITLTGDRQVRPTCRTSPMSGHSSGCAEALLVCWHGRGASGTEMAFTRPCMAARRAGSAGAKGSLLVTHAHRQLPDDCIAFIQFMVHD